MLLYEKQYFLCIIKEDAIIHVLFLSDTLLCHACPGDFMPSTKPLYSSKILTISPSKMRLVFFTAQKLPHMLQVSSFSGAASAR